MPLQDQVIPVSFDKGINTKVDPKQLMPGELISLKNGNFVTPKEITESLGYRALTNSIYNSSVTISNGNSLGKFQDLITMNDGTTQYSYSESINKFIDKGVKIASSVSAQTINTGVAQVFAGVPNSIISGVNVLKMANGFECYYYAYNVELNGSSSIPTALVIFDPLIGEIVYFNTSINYSQNAVAFGNLIIFLNNTTYFTVDVTSPTTTTTGAIGPFSQIFAVSQAGTNYYVLAMSSSGNLVFNEYTMGSLLTSTITVVASATVTTGALINDTFNSRFILTWTDGTTASYAIYSYTSTTILGATAVTFTTAPGSINTLTGGVYDSTSLSLYYQVGLVYNISGTPATSVNQAITQFSLVSGTLTEGQTWFNVSLASNAIPDGKGSQYIAFGHFITKDTGLPQTANSTDQPNYFMMLLTQTTYTIIGKYAEDTAANFPISNLSNLISLSSTEILFPYAQSNGEGMVLPEFPISGGTVFTEINVYNAVRGLLSIGTKLNSVYLGNNENLTGGQSAIYDNVGVAESGFNLFPEVIDTLASSALGAIFLAPGTYSYQLIYQWFDAQGNKHRSSPSDPFNIVNSNSHGSNVMEIAGLSMSEMYKVNNVQILIYRNAPTINTQVYFLVGSVLNDPRGVINFSDITPDADIIGAEQLYTTGGEVNNSAPPSFSSTTAYKNRIVGVQADNPYIWWFSKQQIEFFPVEFSNLFTQVMDGSRGSITAVRVMDANLIFFCQNGIYYVSGDGPSPAGTNNDFSYPQTIVTDTSCNNNNSIVLLPIGLMFASPKGIHLLDRTLQVTYIGAPVRNFNSRTISSAALVPKTTQVRFTFSDGSALMYDYLVQQWSELSQITAVDSNIYDSNYTYLQPDGTILIENPGDYSNNGVPVTLSLTTGWFSFANLQGFQRIKQFLLLITSKNATSLQISVAYDYNPISQVTKIIPVNATSIPQQFRVFMETQKCQAMQITIQEIPTSTTEGGGLTLSGLNFIMGVKKGSNKIAASQSYG